MIFMCEFSNPSVEENVLYCVRLVAFLRQTNYRTLISCEQKPLASRAHAGGVAPYSTWELELERFFLFCHHNCDRCNDDVRPVLSRKAQNSICPLLCETCAKPFSHLNPLRPPCVSGTGVSLHAAHQPPASL